MAHTNRPRRLYMEVLEVRRVLTSAPTAIDVGANSNLIGPQLTQQAVQAAEASPQPGLTDLFIESATAAPLEPTVPQWISNGSTSTLGFYVTGNQLVVPDIPLVSLDDVSTGTAPANDFTYLFGSAGNLITIVANSDGNSFENLALDDGNANRTEVDSRGPTAVIANSTTNVGLQPTLDIQPTLRWAESDALLEFSQRPPIASTVDLDSILESRSTPVNSGWAFLEIEVNTTPLFSDGQFARNGQEPVVGLGLATLPPPTGGQSGGSLFDVTPIRSGLDVTELPVPGPGIPSPITNGLDNPPPPVGDGNDPGPAGPDDGDVPQAPAFVTVDIGSNHPEAEQDLSGMGVMISLDASRRERILPGEQQSVISEIDMARQHRLQLAAAGQLPAPIGKHVKDDYSRVAPESYLYTELGPTDLVWMVGREMTSESWFNLWIAESQLRAEETTSPQTQVADDAADEQESDLPASQRADLLIDAHSRSEQPARSKWQWAVDAFLASAGMGAMIFYDRYGHLAEEKREFRLRS